MPGLRSRSPGRDRGHSPAARPRRVRRAWRSRAGSSAAARTPPAARGHRPPPPRRHSPAPPSRGSAACAPWPAAPPGPDGRPAPLRAALNFNDAAETPWSGGGEAGEAGWGGAAPPALRGRGTARVSPGARREVNGKGGAPGTAVEGGLLGDSRPEA